VTLVLLPPIGLGVSCWDWVELPDVPTVKHEYPGLGARPRAAEQPTMATLAAEVAALYEGPLDLVGISMGGMVAQHVTLDHPERVRSLLVACTGATVDPAVMAARAQAAEDGGMEAVLPETLERWFTPQALSARPPHAGVEHAKGALLALDPHGFADGWRAMAGHDVLARLASIRAPTTCIAGNADPVGTIERVSELADGISGARIVVLEGPHMIHLERPVEFGGAVQEHLARVGGG
jgi:3-oxoadipate enol-lactonase